MISFKKIFEKSPQKVLITREELAEFIRTDPQALCEFEETYTKRVINKDKFSDNCFEINAKQAVRMRKKHILPESVANQVNLDAIVQRIAAELLDSSVVYVWDGKESHMETFDSLPEDYTPLTKEEIMSVPEAYRPELSGYLYKKDISDEISGMLLSIYRDYLNCTDLKKKKKLYECFRQGLDINDLDSITYRIIDRNVNSMGYWLPPLAEAVKKQHFFKIPNTKILKVPLPLLQLTRMNYMELTPSTLCIVDEFCYNVFGLEPDKEYFIKTGTYSSKYDFRNAHVVGEKEVQELGEYLLFIHQQALSMAHYNLSGRNQPAIYGVSTTTEWVVRDYIQPPSGTPEIYSGLPLRPEYRIFVDFDTKQILGYSPYWEPEIMKKHFGSFTDSPSKFHDYIIFSAEEDKLMEQYNRNIGRIIENLKEMIPNIHLTGQWSIDIMQNGNDFFLIDMALAENSALNQCVPKKMLKKSKEDWIPQVGRR